MKNVLFLLLLIILISCGSPSKKGEINIDQNSDSITQTIDTVSSEKPVEETEEDEATRVAKEKFEEEEKIFKELGTYDGSYKLNTESEGAEGMLELKYSGNRVFKVTLMLKALDICEGAIEGEVFMDRTQHGIYREGNCYLHFNFMGNYTDSGNIVEIEQEEKCDKMKGDCIFTGTYQSNQ